MLSSLNVHADMLCAIHCLRAEGIKTALLTNNFNLPNRRHLPLADASLFDVVSRLQSSFACLTWYYLLPAIVFSLSLATVASPAAAVAAASAL